MVVFFNGATLSILSARAAAAAPPFRQGGPRRPSGAPFVNKGRGGWAATVCAIKKRFADNGREA
jgi:hypothetical protein